jgi:hypothetical protein
MNTDEWKLVIRNYIIVGVISITVFGLAYIYNMLILNIGHMNSVGLAAIPMIASTYFSRCIVIGDYNLAGERADHKDLLKIPEKEKKVTR